MVSLKRYPDTKPAFFSSLLKTLMPRLGRRGQAPSLQKLLMERNRPANLAGNCARGAQWFGLAQRG